MLAATGISRYILLSPAAHERSRINRVWRAAQIILMLLALTAVPAQLLAAELLINPGSDWKFLDDGSDQGTAWRAATFNDGGWSSGPGVLGFGDYPGDQTTLINNHDGAGVDALTWYFRYSFDVSDPGRYTALEVMFLRDDGGVVYLNGNEIFRSNMPAGDIDFDTPAASAIGDSAEDTYYSSGPLPNTLTPGGNVLAVEVHQNSNGSSDVSFDLSLVGLNDLSRGPYLQQHTPTSVVIRWSTHNATSSRVRWGSAVGSLTNSVDNSTAVNDHEVTVTGLAPGATLFYSIGSTTQVLAGDDADHFFVMPPQHGTVQKTRVWALGDSGTANGNAAAVRDAYYAFTGTTHTDLWLMLGDNAYNDGTDPQYQAAVFDMYPEMLRKSTLWPTVGNHERASIGEGGAYGAYYDIFTLPEQAATSGASTGVDSGTEAYYSFDFGNIHFIVLESDETNATFRSNMAAWLAADIAATTAVWVVAIWHHPSYTKGSHDSDAESRLIYMRQNILPLLETGGVDLALTGHSHAYERSYLIDGHYGDSDSFAIGSHALDGGDGKPGGNGAYRKNIIGQAPNQGAVYVVAGSSGKISGVQADAPHEAMRNLMPLQVLGSVVLDFDDNVLDATFLTSTGAVSDNFRIEKAFDVVGKAWFRRLCRWCEIAAPAP